MNSKLSGAGFILLIVLFTNCDFSSTEKNTEEISDTVATTPDGSAPVKISDF
jgi:hypothetical protein